MIIRMVLFTDDPMIILMVLSTNDPMIKFRFFCRILQAIRWSYFSFFAENYRRSDDHISVFLPKITDDPMITFRFFSHFLLSILSLLVFNQLGWFLLFLVQTDDHRSPMIRWYFFGIYLPMNRRSFDLCFTDDSMIINRFFLLKFTDDPMIKIWILLPMIRWSYFQFGSVNLP